MYDYVNKGMAVVLSSTPIRVTQKQLMTRNSKLNTGLHNQRFIIEPQ